MLIGSNVMTMETDGTSCVRGDTIGPYAPTRCTPERGGPSLTSAAPSAPCFQ